MSNPVTCSDQHLVCPDVYEFEDTVTYHFRFNVSFSGCDTDAIVKFQGTATDNIDTLSGLSEDAEGNLYRRPVLDLNKPFP